MINIHHFAEGGEIVDEAALEQFQKQWATYQKLVDNNSLASKQAGQLLHAALAELPKPFAFVDIACGDAGQMQQALTGTKIAHYHGIDLSQPALDLAAKNLRSAPFEVELDQGDFVEALEQRPEPADAAWCGLSIHHLSTVGKLELLKAIHRSTSDFLMIYEPTLADGEDRDGYLARFRRVNRPAWSFFSDDEWAQIDHHVTTCDFPETATTWLELGRQAGFSKAESPFLDPTGFYGIYRYDRGDPVI
jgi:hypothetical protein